MSAILNSWASFVRLRPALVEVVVSTLTQWTPANLEGVPLAHIKSVEKSVRILLVHISRQARRYLVCRMVLTLSRIPQAASFTTVINGALATQAARVEQAVIDDKQRKAAAAEASKKRSSITPAQDGPDTKRPKIEHPPDSAAAMLSTFDFTQLPVNLVTDLIVANLQAFSENTLIGLVRAYRHRKSTAANANAAVPSSASASVSVSASASTSTQALTPVAPAIPTGPRSERQLTKSATPPPAPAVKEEKEEPIDPLQMVADDDELEYEPDRLNLEVRFPNFSRKIYQLTNHIQLSGGQDAAIEDGVAMEVDLDVIADLPSAVFKLSPPKELSNEDRDLIVRNSIVRIWDGARELMPPSASSEADAASHLDSASSNAARTGADMWMLLLVRLVTRVAHPPPIVPLEDGDEAQQKADETDADANANAVSEIDAHQDRLRQTLCDYIMADFGARYEFIP